LAGTANDPKITLRTEYQRSGDLVLIVKNEDRHPQTLEIGNHMHTVKPGGERRIRFRLGASYCWYDFTVKVGAFSRRFAGRVETGKLGYSDPVMGGLR
jgi:phospholipase C